MQNVKKYTLNLSVSLLSLVVTVFILELLLRQFFPQIPLQLKDLYVEDQIMGLWYKPGYNGRIVTDEFDVKVSINSLGFRDYERKINPDSLKILAIGDSFTFGSWVALDDTHLAILEKSLNEEYETPFQIIKAGGPAQGTMQQRIFLEERGVQFDPNIVLLGFFVGNDVRDTMVGLKPYQIIDGLIAWDEEVLQTWRAYDVLQDEWQDLPTPAPPAINEEINEEESKGITWQEWLRSNSHLYQFVAQNIRLIEEETVVTTPTQPARLTIFNYETFYLKEYPSEIEKGWQETVDNLTEINELVQADGRELVIFVIPTKEQVQLDHWQAKLDLMLLSEDLFELDKPQQLLVDWAEEENVQLIDLLPQFRTIYENEEVNLYYEQDPHWNEDGYELAGEILTEYFLTEFSDIK